MDQNLTDEQIAIRDEARRFVEKELLPHAGALDRWERDVREPWPRLAEAGYLAPEFPEEYGGAGIDSVSSALLAIEMARGCPATALTAGASTWLCGGAILHHGTEEQKRKYLPPLANGKAIGAWGLTEPSAGSDVLAMKSRATEVDGGFVLSGTKTFITNAPIADTFIVYAWTDPPEGHKGISTFILERGMKGLSTSKPFHKMGFRGSPTGEIIMEEVFVPKENLLGHRGMGFYEAAASLNAERAMAPCLAIGMMERALELASAYAKEREAFGRPIAAFQAIQMKLARIYMDLEHCRAMLYRLLALRDAGEPFAKEASAAKVFSSEALIRTALEAIQIHGGYGYMEEYEVERILRDAKLLQIGAGASEIQLLLIARMLLGDFRKKAPKENSAAKTETAAASEPVQEAGAKATLEKLCERYQPGGPDNTVRSIAFDFKEEGAFRLVLDGKSCRLEEAAGSADTTIRTSLETWSGIVSGKLNPEAAFMQGTLRVDGDVSNALLLSNPKVFRRR